MRVPTFSSRSVSEILVFREGGEGMEGEQKGGGEDSFFKKRKKDPEGLEITSRGL